MTAGMMLVTLARWRDTGWLRRLDVALAAFVAETEPAAPASLLLAIALVAQLEGRGHSGLPLAALVAERVDELVALLSWPTDATEPLLEALAAGPDEPGDAGALPAAWSSLSTLEIEPADDSGSSPLVLSAGLLYLRRYWRCETRLAAQIRARVSGALDSPPAIDVSAASTLLDRLFPRADGDAAADWQKIACALALRGRLTLITGGPGTGKTYTAARLLVLLQSLQRGPQALRVALAAPTGKAAARLRQSISQALQDLGEAFGPALGLDAWVDRLGPARTLHALLGTQPGTRRFRHDASHPLDVDLLVVDEASMVHLEMMALLLEALPASARVVLLGDKDQLASVEAGAVLGDLCQGAGEGGAVGGCNPGTAAWVERLTGQPLPPSALGAGPALAQQTVVLRRSHRFDGPIGQLALALNRGDAPAALALLRADADGPVAMPAARDTGAVLRLALQGRAGVAGGYRAYLARLAERPDDADVAAFAPWARVVLRSFDTFRVLCAVRDGAWGVAGLNAAIERALVDAGLISRRGEWYEGRPLMVTRNSPALGVFNGDIGIVLRTPGPGAALRCWFLDGDALHSVSVARLADVETAFAMTVHKSQGSEFEHVVLVLPEDDAPVLTRELLYTGITRARRALTLVAPQPGLLTSAAGRRTRRISGLRQRLQGDVGGA
jgi:exodeoxyribonuclease V alpha subunit